MSGNADAALGIEAAGLWGLAAFHFSHAGFGENPRARRLSNRSVKNGDVASEAGFAFCIECGSYAVDAIDLQAWRQFPEATYNANMEIHQRISPDSIEIIPASPEQEPVLANLLELYIYDFSEIIDLKLGENGRFGYQSLSLYWTDSSRYPFLIMANGHLSGFVLLRKGSQISRDNDIWDMTEFFIVRGSRRLGVGMKVAQMIWKQFPGKWEVRVRDKNQRAIEFWAHTVSEYLGKTFHSTPFELNGEGWQVFSFES